MDGELAIPAGDVILDATFAKPDGARGVVAFAHGSGSGRHSPRNRYVAGVLNDGGFATVLADLLTVDEERVDERTRQLRFDIGLLARRVTDVVDWMGSAAETSGLPVGLFGASTGAAAALVCAANRAETVHGVVSRGGRPDLAGDALPSVEAPTLLLVGGRDEVVLGLNREAFDVLACEKQLEIIPGATHLFEEPGTLERVSELAGAWFAAHL